MTGICERCGLVREIHRHHIVPRSDGGSDDKSNLCPLCELCHSEYHRFYDHTGLTHGAKRQEFSLFLGTIPVMVFVLSQEADAPMIDNDSWQRWRDFFRTSSQMELGLIPWD